MVTSKMTRGGFVVFSLSISPHHSCLSVTVLIIAGLHAKLRSRYHSLCVRLRFSRRSSAAPVCAAETRLFAPCRPKPLLRRGNSWRPKPTTHPGAAMRAAPPFQPRGSPRPTVVLGDDSKATHRPAPSIGWPGDVAKLIRVRVVLVVVEEKAPRALQVQGLRRGLR